MSDAAQPPRQEVDERPQRRREYSGPGSTLGLAALIVIVVALGVWFVEFSGRDGAGGFDDGYGVTALPDGLNPTGEPPAAEVGRAAPNFLLQDLGGSELDLAALRGRYVLINFWASWCEPCRTETPELQALAEDHAPAGDLVVLGINLQEPPATAQRFAAQFGVTYPILLDRNGDVATTYRLAGPPTSYLVGPDGVIVAIFQGELTGEHYARIAEEFAG